MNGKKKRAGNFGYIKSFLSFVPRYERNYN